MSSFFPSCIPEGCPQIPVELFLDDLPPIPFCENGTADISDLAVLMSADGLPSPGTWSYEWFQYNIPTEIYEQYATGDTCAIVFLGALLACLSYQMFYKYWMGRSKIFRELSPDGQVTVVQHSIQAVYLTLLFAPVTWAMLSVNFQVPKSEETVKRQSTTVAAFMIWIVHVYLIELGAKFRSMRGLVMVHHLCATADAILPLFVMSAVNLRCAAVLTYFITWEAGVFFGLLMYRLFPLNKWTPRVIKLGMLVFGLSRPVQMLWIVMLVKELWEYSEPWHGIVQLLFGVFFSSLQLYSLLIHSTLLKKCLKAQQNAMSEEGLNHASSAEEALEKSVVAEELQECAPSFEKHVAAEELQERSV